MFLNKTIAFLVFNIYRNVKKTKQFPNENFQKLFWLFTIRIRKNSKPNYTEPRLRMSIKLGSSSKTEHNKILLKSNNE